MGDSELPFAGKGVFAERRFKEGEIVTISPALAMPRFSIAELGESSLLQNYCITEDRSAVCLLPIGAAGMINHHENPNAIMEWYEWPSLATGKIKEQLALNMTEILSKPYTELYLGYRALRNISQGEELTINYGRAWTNDWSQYLTHLVHFLELKFKGSSEVDVSSLHLPLFRSFIQPPAGMKFPSQWSISDEEWNEYLDSFESMWDVESWERDAEMQEAHADAAEAAYGEDHSDGNRDGEDGGDQDGEYGDEEL
jgi:hypothetical protein